MYVSIALGTRVHVVYTPICVIQSPSRRLCTDGVELFIFIALNDGNVPYLSFPMFDHKIIIRKWIAFLLTIEKMESISCCNNMNTCFEKIIS